MRQYWLPLSIGTAFLVTFFVAVLFNAFSPQAVLQSENATTSGTLEAASTTAALPAPALEAATTSVESTPAPTAAPAKTKTETVTKTQVVQLAPVPVYSQAQMDAAASVLRGALVNIICDAPPGSRIRSISGSGIVVDSKGFILTNAHVAQYFLLEDQGVSCVIRTGSPAQSKYTASLVFISSAWISANSTVFTETAPAGTGEHDLALLAIDGSVTGEALPGSFPYVPLAVHAPQAGEPVVIGSYAAQFLQSAQIVSALSPTLVFGSIKQLFTFSTNTADIFSLGGSVAAQEGSSGGGVADGTGNLVGTITTSTVEGDTSTRNVNAITATYVRAEYASETGEPIEFLFARDTATAIRAFMLRIPALEQQLVAHL